MSSICESLNSKVSAIADFFIQEGSSISRTASLIYNAVEFEGDLATAKQRLATAREGLRKMYVKQSELQTLEQQLAENGCSQAFVAQVLGQAQQYISDTDRNIIRGIARIEKFEKDVRDAEEKAKQEQEEFEKNANKPQDPPPAEETPSVTENQEDDDGSYKQNPGENQNPEVVSNIGNPVNVSASGSGQGTAASPGPSGVGGKDLLPGRRTYNPLSKLSSYTYNISLYMITPDAYDAFIQSGRKKIDALSQARPIGGGSDVGAGAFIIAQSGGINNKTQNRAPGFELDYYIDNIVFTTLTSQNQLQASAFVNDLKMVIIEPYGFSFLSNLRRALEGLKDYTQNTSYKDQVNSLDVFYIIGIRFYGYDANGNVLKGSDEIYGEAIDPGNGTEALFEKFYDLSLKTLKFQLNPRGGGTQYFIEFSPIAGSALFGTKRSRINTGARVTGKTVSEMLTGPDGLLTKLNKEQQDQTDKNPPLRKIANTFEIKFMGEAAQRISQAKMKLDSDLEKWRWPGSIAENTTGVNDNTGIKAIPDSESRELVFNNDTMIIRAIGNIIQKSEFMEKALKTVYNNVLQPDSKQKNIEQIVNNEPQKLSWYNISAEITKPEWDTLLNDWAYKTTYIITLYEIPSISTPFSNFVTNYYGPHKYFYYWLTGQNTEVIDFSLTFNNNYFNTVVQVPFNGIDISGLPPGTNEGTTSITPMLRSGGDTTGSLNVGGEAQAAVETSIYDPQAFTQGKIIILGDPDFMMRDQVSSVDTLYQKFYDTDQFTASAHGGMVFAEIILKEAEDYKNSIGLQEINESIQFYPYPKSVRDVAKGIIYRVDSVTSSFMSGKFIQTLSLSGANEWPRDPGEENNPGDTREDQNQSSTSGGTNSGSSSGAGNGTANNTGLRSDASNSRQNTVGNGTTNTVGNETQGTVSTTDGPIADDDSLNNPSLIIQEENIREESPAQRRIREARERQQTNPAVATVESVAQRRIREARERQQQGGSG